MAVMKKSNKEDAVSPVIGVMLMLVVTIIVAAVVATFAGGLSTDVETAPNTVLDVKIYEKYVSGGYTYPSLQVKSIGGDPISTEDMVLKFSWIGEDGDIVTSTYSGGKTFNANGDVPVMAVMPLSGSLQTEYSAWYGNVTLFNGEVLQSMGLFERWYSVNDNPSFKAIFGEDNVDEIKKGKEIHVVIMHDNHVIFDKEVIVL